MARLGAIEKNCPETVDHRREREIWIAAVVWEEKEEKRGRCGRSALPPTAEMVLLRKLQEPTVEGKWEEPETRSFSTRQALYTKSHDPLC